MSESNAAEPWAAPSSATRLREAMDSPVIWHGMAPRTAYSPGTWRRARDLITSSRDMRFSRQTATTPIQRKHKPNASALWATWPRTYGSDLESEGIEPINPLTFWSKEIPWSVLDSQPSAC